MKGVIVNFSREANLYTIAGEDGNKYHFSIEDWKCEQTYPQHELRVFFSVDEERAIEVTIDREEIDNTLKDSEKQHILLGNIKKRFSKKLLIDLGIMGIIGLIVYIPIVLKILDIKESFDLPRLSVGENIAGTINRTQQTQHFEELRFFPNLNTILNSHLVSFTEIDYKYYDINITEVDKNRAIVNVIAKHEELVSFVGAIYYSELQGYHSIVCMPSELPIEGSRQLPFPIFNGKNIKCAIGTRKANLAG